MRWWLAEEKMKRIPLPNSAALGEGGGNMHSLLNSFKSCHCKWFWMVLQCNSANTPACLAFLKIGWYKITKKCPCLSFERFSISEKQTQGRICNAHKFVRPLFCNQHSNHGNLLFIIARGKFSYLPNEWEHFGIDIAGVVMQTYVRLSHWPECLLPVSSSAHLLRYLLCTSDPCLCYCPLL